jgi:hypothetical protein
MTTRLGSVACFSRFVVLCAQTLRLKYIGQARFPFVSWGLAREGGQNDLPQRTDWGIRPRNTSILGDAMDEAWRRLEGGVHLNGSADAARTVLAEHIIAMAGKGERTLSRR